MFSWAGDEIKNILRLLGGEKKRQLANEEGDSSFFFNSFSALS